LKYQLSHRFLIKVHWQDRAKFRAGQKQVYIINIVGDRYIYI
jgi:heme-degrading monooxygenase HmoA